MANNNDTNNELTRDNSGHKIQAFSPNPNLTKIIALSPSGNDTITPVYPQEIAYLIHTEQDICIIFNDDGIDFCIVGGSWYGVVLNDKITSIKISDTSGFAHTVKVQVM